MPDAQRNLHQADLVAISARGRQMNILILPRAAPGGGWAVPAT
ncbi:MAG: hypothetical protein ABW194_00860 [Novosphingobium sp.]